MTGSYSCMSRNLDGAGIRPGRKAIVVSVLLGTLAAVHAVMPRAVGIRTAEDHLASSTVTARGSSS